MSNALSRPIDRSLDATRSMPSSACTTGWRITAPCIVPSTSLQSPTQQGATAESYHVILLCEGEGQCLVAPLGVPERPRYFGRELARLRREVGMRPRRLADCLQKSCESLFPRHIDAPQLARELRALERGGPGPDWFLMHPILVIECSDRSCLPNSELLLLAALARDTLKEATGGRFRGRLYP
jgi:hypothetical protein